MNILGISALYHDSAAALVCDGTIIAAAQEERFSRKKHDNRYPINAIEFCLSQGHLNKSDIDVVVFYDNPVLTLDRMVTNLAQEKNDYEDLLKFQLQGLLEDKLWIHKMVKEHLGTEKIFVTKHHVSHAASAFFPSPYEKAAIITVDGVGEYDTTTIGIGSGNNIKLIEKISYPHSIGLLYSAFTYFCGFKVNSGDYKFMGLAPYGEPIYYERIKNNIINVKEDGSFELNMEYFDYQHGRTMTSDKFAELFDGPAREPESVITKREMDIAASAQKLVEEILIQIARHAKKVVGEDVKNLVLAGGVALNCVANGKIQREHIFDNIWIQPAAGDAGGALGAALFYWYQTLGNERICDNKHDFQRGSYLGPKFNDGQIQQYLDKIGASYEKIEDKDALYKKIAELINDNKVIGLFQGNMEFGPRALGNRSIIASATSEEMQSKLNLKIKYRESFRPFAPSVLDYRSEDYFEIDCDSPYMLLVAEVQKSRRFDVSIKEELQKTDYDMLPIVNQKRSDIPAVTHIDYSARVQSVSEETNSYYFEVIKAYEKLTGHGVIVNTSFNVRGEPIVCNPKDAYVCFMRTEMDVLVLENFILMKKDQKQWSEDHDWRQEYELD